MFNFFFFITYQALIRLLNLCHNDRSLLVLELTEKCKCIIFDTKDCNKKAFLYEVFIY